MTMQATPIPSQDPFADVGKVSSLVAVKPEEIVLARQPTPDIQPLSELLPVDRLFITKRLRVRNVLFLRGKKNRFFVRTSDQTLVYTIEEENRQVLISFNSWWVGYFCYGLRPLQLRVLNGQGSEVMRIHRPYSCTARILPCQLQHLEVYSPPGQLIGSVEQQWTPVKPMYVVKNGDGESLFWIHGPCITLSCFRDVQFSIVRPDGTAVGATCKRWQGLMHALFFAPVTDKFGVAFERDMPVEEKALLLAATLLMDYMYYDA
uniref:Phospholipid scramblase n=1 Tax=Heliothis virescens TaxID=7102 RepID=A0A2A4K9R9_HELVI